MDPIQLVTYKISVVKIPESSKFSPQMVEKELLSQGNHLVPNQNDVFAIFSEFFLEDMDAQSARANMISYVQENYDTVTLMSEKLFAKKKTNLEQ